MTYYKIVKAKLEEELELAVSKHVEDGWYCIGAPDLRPGICRQAMERDPRGLEKSLENLPN